MSWRAGFVISPLKSEQKKTEMEQEKAEKRQKKRGLKKDGV